MQSILYLVATGCLLRKKNYGLHCVMPKLTLTDDIYHRNDTELKKTIIQGQIICVCSGSCIRYFSSNYEVELNKIREMALVFSAAL